MNSRRFHTKTRTGCTQCKQRRTKCDETKPNCTKCVRRNETCSYQSSSLTIIPHSFDLDTPPEKFASAPLPERTLTINSKIQEKIRESMREPPVDTQVSMAARYSLQNDPNDTLRLLHHYAISSCISISDSEGVLPMWRDVIPAMAFEKGNEYLLSILLAVTALHLALLQPNEEHTKAAVHHYTLALEQVQPHLTEISKANISPLFTFACLIPLYSFGIHETSLSTAPILPQTTELFTLIQGITAIVVTGYQWLNSGPLSFYTLPEVTDPSAPLPPALEASLALLSQRKPSTPPASVEEYSKALALLRHTFLLHQDSPNMKVAILPLPILVATGFVEKLKDSEPLALSILAHYAVILYRLRHHIWLRGWGKEIIDAVAELLGGSEEWRECMVWPQEQIEEREEGEEGGDC
ncbi:hypothetical protein B0J14DRAFT_635204 [Halenospora varia]|nr:hypothetical protein B0J14DRAFT_635204 [Halenospora varia]